MKKVGFTPGPWTVPSASFPEDGKGVAFHVCAENICMSAGNAKLIAAAPELYEALDEALCLIPASQKTALTKFNAVLAKARCEQVYG